MITLYDHIQELRAELRGCYFTRRERAAVQAELANAIAEQAELDHAFDAALEALSDPTEADRGRRVSGPFPLPLLFAIYATRCYHPVTEIGSAASKTRARGRLGAIPQIIQCGTDPPPQRNDHRVL